MTKLCIDFGSGYNPKTGYKTCDITTFPQLDFQYDGKDEIVGLREKSVDVFYLRNVVHHIPDLQRTFTTLKKYLKVGGKLAGDHRLLKAMRLTKKWESRKIRNDVNKILEKNPFKPRDLQRSALRLMRYGCSKA